QVEQLSGHALWRRDQGMEEAGAVDNGGNVAVDIEVVEDARHRAQQQGGDDRAKPVVGAADDGQGKKQNRVAGRESPQVELADKAGEKAATDAGEEPGKGEGPDLVADDVDAG